VKARYLLIGVSAWVFIGLLFSWSFLRWELALAGNVPTFVETLHRFAEFVSLFISNKPNDNAIGYVCVLFGVFFALAWIVVSLSYFAATFIGKLRSTERSKRI
jgi:hypothetical protein